MGLTVAHSIETGPPAREVYPQACDALLLPRADTQACHTGTIQAKTKGQGEGAPHETTTGALSAQHSRTRTEGSPKPHSTISCSSSGTHDTHESALQMCAMVAIRWHRSGHGAATTRSLAALLSAPTAPTTSSNCMFHARSSAHCLFRSGPKADKLCVCCVEFESQNRDCRYKDHR